MTCHLSYEDSGLRFTLHYWCGHDTRALGNKKYKGQPLVVLEQSRPHLDFKFLSELCGSASTLENFSSGASLIYTGG